MKLIEVMPILKDDSSKRVQLDELVIGYAPRFEQFYEIEDGRHVYFTDISTRILFLDGWKIIDA